MEMAQDCNQRQFGTRLSASIHLCETGLCATETAFIQPGLQSTALGPHYMRLTGTTVFGLSLCEGKHIPALEVFLSRTSLDLGPRVSHNASINPIDTLQLSHFPCARRVYPPKTAGRERWR